MSLRQVVKDYHACAEPKAAVDYAFHLIISDPTEQVLGQELPALIQDGYTSFKIFMNAAIKARASATIPLRFPLPFSGVAGTSFKHEHLAPIVADGPQRGFFGVHAN